MVSLNAGGIMTDLRAGSIDRDSATITVDVSCTTVDRWDISVSIDGDIRVGTSDVFMRTGLMTPLHGIDIGLCRGSPVSWGSSCVTGHFIGAARSATSSISRAPSQRMHRRLGWRSFALSGLPFRGRIAHSRAGPRLEHDPSVNGFAWSSGSVRIVRLMLRNRVWTLVTQ